MADAIAGTESDELMGGGVALADATANADVDSMAISKLTVTSNERGFADGKASADAEFDSGAAVLGTVTGLHHGEAVGQGTATAIFGSQAIAEFNATATNGGQATATADAVAICTGFVCDTEDPSAGAVAIAQAEADGDYMGPAKATADADAIALGDESLASALSVAKADVEEGYTAGVADADTLAIAIFGGEAESVSLADARNINPSAGGTNFDLATAFGAGGAAWAWGYTDADANVALSGATTIAVMDGTVAFAGSTAIADDDVYVGATVTSP